MQHGSQLKVGMLPAKSKQEVLVLLLKEHCQLLTGLHTLGNIRRGIADFTIFRTLRISI